jgi:type IV pilus assembly protein PilV
MNLSMIFKKNGFSLIEVLIALIFLAIGLLAMASLQVTSVRGNFFSNNLMQATYIAQDRLEFLKNLPLDAPSLGPGNHEDGTTQVADLLFNRSYSVENDPNGYLKMNYLVRWNDGSDHSISFSTIRSQ